MKAGDRVRHTRTGALGTIVYVNDERRPTRDGRTLDLYVAWDERHGRVYGAMFTEVVITR